MTHPDSAEATRLLRDAGAVLQMGFVGTAPPDWLRRRLAAGELGGVALFRRNIANTAQLAALNAALRAENPDILVCIDEEGGDVTRLEIERGSSYPGNLALGYVDDPKLTEAVAASIGRDLAAVGVNLNYAPDADVNANPDNPVIGSGPSGPRARWSPGTPPPTSGACSRSASSPARSTSPGTATPAATHISASPWSTSTRPPKRSTSPRSGPRSRPGPRP